jgi:uncharacterized protein YjbI with pentapeptide repeats
MYDKAYRRMAFRLLFPSGCCLLNQLAIRPKNAKGNLMNEEHVTILLQGVDAWNEWQRANRANLAGANLSGVDLKDADLTGADLKGADLQGADPTKAIGYPPNDSHRIWIVRFKDAPMGGKALRQHEPGDALLIEGKLRIVADYVLEDVPEMARCGWG